VARNYGIADGMAESGLTNFPKIQQLSPAIDHRVGMIRSPAVAGNPKRLK